MSDSHSLGIGLVGCGLVGQKRVQSLPAGSVKIVCDLAPGKAASLAQRLGTCRSTGFVEDVLGFSDVQVVLIATFNAALARLASKAVEAGKHVLVEKPGAVSVAELEALESTAQRHGRWVRVGYNHRYHPAIQKAQEIFQSGAIGEIMFVRGRYGQGGRIGYDREWRADAKLSGGGELIDQGVHLIDLAGIFLGPITHVEGHVATYYWDMPVDDNAFLSLRDAAGKTAWLHVSCTEWKNLFSLEIYGRNGKLHIEGLGGSYGTERLYHYQMRPQMGPPDTIIYEYSRADESWKLEMQEFLEDIRLNRMPVPGLREARLALKVVEEIHSRKTMPRHSGSHG